MAGLRVTQQWPQRENLADFVAHKREIFLVQMSLDTKRALIREMEVCSLHGILQDLKAQPF